MRVYVNNTKQYIQGLAAAIAKDPVSFSAWECVHIAPTDTDWAGDAALEQLKQEHEDVDCDILVCSDQDVLLVSRDLGGGALQNLAGALISTVVDEAPEIHSYNLQEDWRGFCALLIKKAGAAASVTSKKDGAFGNKLPLQNVFESTSYHRKTRKSHYVMVVEDDPTTLRIISAAFNDLYTVISATNAHDALSNYLLYAPDIVFLDIGLPDSSGFGVLHDVVATDSDAYVVMFSGSSHLDNVIKALNEGASGFVSKPFRKEQLLHYIEDSILRHRG